MSGLREALVELADEWGRYGPMAPAVLAEVDSILAARQAPTVALGVEMVARIQFEASARMVALEVGLDDPVTWAELGDKDRQHLLDCAAAVVAADPRRTEAEVKAEALREAADALGPISLEVSAGFLPEWLRKRADQIRGEGGEG